MIKGSPPGPRARISPRRAKEFQISVTPRCGRIWLRRSRHNTRAQRIGALSAAWRWSAPVSTAVFRLLLSAGYHSQFRLKPEG